MKNRFVEYKSSNGSVASLRPGRGTWSGSLSALYDDTRFSKVLDVALLLANDKALLAGVLDLVLPRLLDQMQADRRMAMVQGCDRSLARVLGWLVTRLRCFVKNPDFWSPHGHIGDISTEYSC